MASPHSPRQDKILATLPEQDNARQLPDLLFTPIPLGWAGYESGGHVSHL